MAYVYGWYAGGDDLFYIGFSSVDDGYKRANRCVGKNHMNEPSRAEHFYIEQNVLKHPVKVKILITGLDNRIALILESALIILYGNLLLNCVHMSLRGVKNIYMTHKIKDTISILLQHIVLGDIKATGKLLFKFSNTVRMIEVEPFRGNVNIISNVTFKDLYGKDVRTFLKSEEPRMYGIKSIKFSDEKGIVYSSIHYNFYKGRFNTLG